MVKKVKPASVGNTPYDGGELHIQGYSHAAAELIGRLDHSGHFSDAQFAAPLVRNDPDGTDRIDLTAKAGCTR